ncbi:endonuclease/exonuclease/phosphatase family protein [Persicimonas caeni]|nr:endonuclease/exonuclease/phosphatase family protein [Persicimonas caeni]
MTYNIRLGIQQGVEAIARVIREQRPDIVALQEVGRGWRMGPEGDTAAELCTQCDLPHHVYVTTIDDDGQHYGHAILSRWPLQNPEIVRFTQNIDEPRAALITRVDADGQPLRIISTHLSHRDPERAVHGTELVELVGKVTSEDCPTLLMGDLNEEDDADFIHALKDRMADAGDLVEGKTYPNPAPMVRIDYLMAHGGRFEGAQILDEREASDHRPLVASLILSSPDS